MAKLILSDLNGSFEIIAFSKKYIEYKQLIEKYKILFIDGRIAIDERNEYATIYLDKMYDVDEYIKIKNDENKPPSVKIAIHFKDKETFVNDYKELYTILGANKGKDYIKVIVNKEKQMKVLRDCPIEVSSNLIGILSSTYGETNIEVMDNE